MKIKTSILILWLALGLLWVYSFAFAESVTVRFNDDRSAVVLDVGPGPITCVSGCDVNPPRPTPFPNQTPSQCDMGLPGWCRTGVWRDGTCVIGPCGCKLCPTNATPQPTTVPTGKITSGRLKAGGMWFCAGEQQCGLVGHDRTWALNIDVRDAIRRKTGQPVAPMEILNGFTGVNWQDSPSVKNAKVASTVARLDRDPTAPIVTLEADIFSWCIGMATRGTGFLDKNKKLRPTSQWLHVIPTEYEQLFKARKGMIYVAPYAFPMVVSLKDKPFGNGKTWIQQANTNEPDLFPLAGWKSHPKAKDIDYPNLQAAKVTQACTNRWLRKLREECQALGKTCGVVLQISNMGYSDLPAADSVWQDLAVTRFPNLLRLNGFEPNVQVELYEDQGKPKVPCDLIKRLQSAGALVSAFDMTGAVVTRGQECM